MSPGRTSSLALFLFACRADGLVLIEPPWPESEIGVFVISPPGIVPTSGSAEIFLEGSAAITALELDPALELRARTFPRTLAPALGPPIETCGVVFGGPGEPLSPHIVGAYVAAPLSRDALPELDFEVEEPRLGIDLRFDACVTPPDPCLGITWTALPTPPGTSLQDLTMVGPEVVVVSATDLETGNGVQLFRLEGQTLTALPPSGIDGGARQIASDRASTLYLLVDPPNDPEAPFDLYRLDLEGQVTHGPELSGIRGVVSGRDGFTLGYSNEGLFELQAGVAGSIPRPELTGFPKLGGRSYLEVVRRNRFFGYANDVIQAFDGSTWRTEFGRGLTQDISGLGGDDFVMVVVGGTERVTLRNEETGQWADLPSSPFGRAIRLRAATGLGGGSFITVGDYGAFAIYRDGIWCPFDTALQTALTSVVAAEGGHLAWALGPPVAEEATSSLLLRIEL